MKVLIATSDVNYMSVTILIYFLNCLEQPFKPNVMLEWLYFWLLDGITMSFHLYRNVYFSGSKILLLLKEKKNLMSCIEHVIIEEKHE
jgi:hypothetical protein